jgi:hypothetical protein
MRCVVLASILATTATAMAEPPSLTPPVDSAPALSLPSAVAPSSYVQIGAEVGFGQDATFEAASVQAGTRVFRFLWARAGLVAGQATPAFPLVSAGAVGGGYMDTNATTAVGGTMFQVRAGLEARGCSPSYFACGFGGVDVAYAQTQLVGGTPADSSGMIMIPRIGFDLGSRRVRIRTALELAYDAQFSVEGAGIDAGVAYQW